VVLNHCVVSFICSDNGNSLKSCQWYVICILAIYTSPVTKFNNVIAQLDMVLQTLHNPRPDQFIYGNINVNHHNDSGRKSQ
jgi:hypothetical protein